MSTTPTEVLETVAATEAGFDFDAVKGILDNFDPATLLPDLSSVFGWMELVCRILVLVGPILLAVLGAVIAAARKADLGAGSAFAAQADASRIVKFVQEFLFPHLNRWNLAL